MTNFDNFLTPKKNKDLEEKLAIKARNLIKVSTVNLGSSIKMLNEIVSGYREVISILDEETERLIKERDVISAKSYEEMAYKYSAVCHQLEKSIRDLSAMRMGAEQSSQLIEIVSSSFNLSDIPVPDTKKN